MNNTIKSKVFLGGTIGKTDWRKELIPLLEIDYFNPVVKDWTPEFIEVENMEKQAKCNIHLYLITSEMTGVYSIAEAVHSAHNKRKVCVFVIVRKGFEESQLKSLLATKNLINEIGGVTKVISNIEDLEYVFKDELPLTQDVIINRK